MTELSSRERKGLAAASLASKPVGLALLATPAAPLGAVVLVFGFSVGLMAAIGAVGSGNGK